MEVAFYSTYKNNRLIYAVEELFRYSNVDNVVWLKEDEISSSFLPVINYSDRSIVNSFCHIHPHELLKSNKGTAPHIKVDEQYDTFIWFKTSSHNLIFDYDILSCIFWCLTCFTEVKTHPGELLNRHSAKDHPLYKEGLLELPHVELLKLAFARAVNKHLKNKIVYSFPDRGLMTVDVDFAWAFKHKTLINKWGGLIKDVFKGDIAAFKARLSYFVGAQSDPFDTYDLLRKASRGYDVPLFYFFLLANGEGIDKSYSIENRYFRKLIKEIGKEFEVGIHFSVGANDQPERFLAEKQALQDILKKPVEVSRQHYISIVWPHTYRELIKAGVKCDYSMGYHDGVGYRAGTCCPYEWYDLTADKATSLKVYPFYGMDAVFKNHLLLSPMEAFHKIKCHIVYMRSRKLPVTLLWHNSSMSPMMGWKGWEKVPFDVLKLLSSDNRS